MAFIEVTNKLDDLARDTRAVAEDAKPLMRSAVSLNVSRGERELKRIAEAKVGRHGANYPKRITSEMTGPLTGEFGPHAGGTPVGAGFRHGVNTDSAQAADIIGPKFADDVSRDVDSLFWRG